MVTTDQQGVLKEADGIKWDRERYTGLPLVKIDPTKKYQDILGFGIALTDASSFLIDRLPEEKRINFLRSIFSSEGLGLSVARLSVGASDYACECYNYDDTPGDTDLKDFTIEHDQKYILPVIKQVKKINPELFLFSSTWSAPGWMKTGGSMFGGWLRQQYLEVYARYYFKYLQEYNRQGIRINALTPQNEVETDQTSRMPATLLHPEFEMAFVKYMKSLLEQNGFDTKIWMMDHNFSAWNRAKWMLDDADVKKAADGVAFHYYEGTPDMMSFLHEAHPEVELHWTEGGPDLGPSYANDWCKWGQVFTEAMQHWCRSITGWNLLLDENGKPNIGPYSCAGLVTVNSETEEFSYSGQYRALNHFSRFVKRNARRLHTEGTPNGINNHALNEQSRMYHIAFENPDGGIVVILTNPGMKKGVQLQFEDKYALVPLPADSISTIVMNE